MIKYHAFINVSNIQTIWITEMESHFIYVTLLHSINVKAMLIILHYGLMTEDDMNTINNKKKSFHFLCSYYFFYAASITFEINVNIPLRYNFSFSYVFVCVLVHYLAHY